MFLASHICCVSSGTLRARYCWLPRDVSGVKPTMKKCSRGNGIRLTASFLRSATHRAQMFVWHVTGAADVFKQLRTRTQAVRGLDASQRPCQAVCVAGMVSGAAPALSWPGKRRQQVTPDMTAEMRWFRSPKVGVVSLSVRKQMS